MKSNFGNRLLIAAVLATAAPLVLTSTTAFAKEGQGKEQKAEKEKKQKQKDHEQQKAAKAATQAARQEDRHERQMATVANQTARQEDRHERQMATVANQAARQEDRAERQAAKRLSKAQQAQLIAAQQQRVAQYQTWQQGQLSTAQQVAAAVQAQNRAQQYAYILDYANRLRQQQQRYSTSNFDYYNDPYFYSAPTYRYQRDGRYYTTNQYGANMLQQAINDGYGEGIRAGRADRMDGWRADYRSHYVYQNATYGFNGYYGDRNEYAYYFRQGFRRGYEDGYYGRQQYGTYRDGKSALISTVLNTILGLQNYNRY